MADAVQSAEVFKTLERARFPPHFHVPMYSIDSEYASMNVDRTDRNSSVRTFFLQNASDNRVRLARSRDALYRMKHGGGRSDKEETCPANNKMDI